jgi:hypothetical protein
VYAEPVAGAYYSAEVSRVLNAVEDEDKCATLYASGGLLPEDSDDALWCME